MGVKDKQIGPDYIQDAIKFIKECPLQGTALKVELEANLNRRKGQVKCIACVGRGWRFCRDCKNGYVDGTRKLICENCAGWARIPCNQCAEKGIKITKVMSDSACTEFMLSHVSKQAKEALSYSLFYPDGSVGSEFTFTLPIDKAGYAVEFVEAFKALGEHIGGGIDTHGAGMHMCILNSPDCYYPGGNSFDNTCASNFIRAIGHFLPTLYFLGSASFKSRGLGFRGPYVGTGKSSAINSQAGGAQVFEFRFFETCYERPEAVLDNLCVIAKMFQFYKIEQTKLPFFGKIGKLGIRDGLGVHRFYFTDKHLKALDQGLKYLKPDHKTIEQLKRERNFTITPERLKKMDTRFDIKTEQEWRSYELREKRDKSMQADKLRKEYLAEVGRYGRLHVMKQLGTMNQYLKRNMRKTDTLKTYKLKKKQENITRGIVREIQV